MKVKKHGNPVIKNNASDLFLYIRVERFTTFFDFQNGHIAADQVLYFYEFNSKKMQKFAAHAHQSLIFKKSQIP